ncbi:hypothetical protein Dimus_011940 [Dionaea muscipula]
MGARLLQLAPPASSPTQPLSPKPAISPSCLSWPPNTRCSATKPGSGGGRPRWDSNAETIRTGRFKFNDEYDASDDSIRFGSSHRRRKWWSDDGSGVEDEEDDDDGDFGLGEQSGGLHWLSKLSRAFGWMLPAVIISMLMGTPNTLIMALALPLGQTAISLAIDKLWGNSGYRQNPRSRAKTKREPFARAASRTNSRERTSTGTRQKQGSYQAWSSTNDIDGRGRTNFGGWDELDTQQGAARGADSSPGEVRAETVPDGLPMQPRNGKLSRRRNLEKPLFLRLLISVFPFLGSWTRLFL